MGDIRRYSCKCGYEEEIYIGCGLMSNDLKTIKMLIPEEIFTAFNGEYFKGNVLDFGSFNSAVRCEKCRRLFTASEFYYRLKNAAFEENEGADAGGDPAQSADTDDSGQPPFREVRYMDKCPDCGGVSVKEDDIEKIICPKCGKEMYYMDIGIWD